MADRIPTATVHEDSAVETDEVVAYHAPSSLAVASLIVGVISPIYILGRVLIIVPLVGIALGVLALRRIAASDGALVGRSLAMAGLALSLTTASAVVSYSLVTRQLRTAQAVEVGNEWFDLVLAGDTSSAFQLSHGYPPPDPNVPQDFGVDGNPYNRFLELPSVQSLLSLRGKPEVRDEGTVRYAALGNGKFLIRRKYTVIPDRAAADSTSRPQNISLILQMNRTTALGMRGMTWRASPVVEEPPAI
jgi:hypothetical protein